MRILIVEDDFISRTLLQEILKPYGNCHQATNGEEAMAAVSEMLDRKEPYQLICLDIMMPGMDGQEVLQRIRDMERARGIGGSDATKIIMTTALDDPKNIMKALLRGPSDGYLTKPIDLGKIKKLLAELGLAPLAPGNATPA